MVWVGGLMFFAIVMVPMLRDKEFQGLAPKIVMWAGLRFRFWGWVCLFSLLTTGLTNLFARGYTWSNLFSREMYDGHFGHTLFIKLNLVGLVFFLSAIHDFWIGPKATKLWSENPDDPKVKQFRKAASWFGRVNLLLSLLIVFCAIMLLRGSPW